MSGQTRADIAFDVCHLGTNLKYPDDKDIKYDNKIIAHYLFSLFCKQEILHPRENIKFCFPLNI